MDKDSDLILYRVLPKYNKALRDETIGGDKSLYQVENGKENRPFIGIMRIIKI